MSAARGDGDAVLKVELAKAYETLHALGIFDYAGDVSARSADTNAYLIRAARVSLNVPVTESRVHTTVGDILTLDFGNQLREGTGQVPIEAAIHGAVYAARPEVRSVIHCHPKMATVLTIAGQELRPVFIRGAELLGSGIPAYPDGDPITNPVQAAKLVSVLGAAYACVLPAHGVVVVGANVAQVCMGVVNLEQSATVQFLASLIGPPKDLPEKSIADRARINRLPDFFSATWSYYTELAESGHVGGSPTTLVQS